LWYSVIRWGRVPSNAQTFFKVTGLANAV
jgi:hypothetical protein